MKIAILGHGVVGSGVVEVLSKNGESIGRKAGAPLEIKYILDRREFPELAYADLFIKDFSTIANDPEVDVVVEVMGGIEPAYSFVKQCLQNGKSVVTSNKELVAAKGAELLALAAQHGKNFFFEASVGGGIPIVKPLHLCLGANEITEIAGILNGTTNFILTKMIREAMSFADALALAQQLGYAEKDPTADVEGHDACRKICILASLAFGKHIYPQYVYCEGITKITAEDVAYADRWGGVIKLIGRAKKLQNGKTAIMVTPAFIARESQLSGVDDVFNGILVRGDATGDVVFYGKGAGKLPTASAVVSDIIDAVRATDTIRTLQWGDGDETAVAPFDDCPVTAFVRIADRGDALGKAKVLFGDIRQLVPMAGEIAFITPALTEGELREKLAALAENDAPLLSMLRVLDY
ncbi:MAG: homoserine dehydrogenase [Angelakisella sp.]